MSAQGQKSKKSKKARAHKVSRGEHGGGGKVALSEVQKVLVSAGKPKGLARVHRDKTMVVIRDGEIVLEKPSKKPLALHPALRVVK